MPVDYNFFKGSLNPLNIFRTIAFNMEFDRQHPNYFYPEGITIFTGAQGQGKTLSAVQMTKKIMDTYPKAILCSNIEIKEINNTKIQFHDIEDIDNVKNGEQGVLFFIDEIQNYLNSLQSKQIPLSTIVQLTQMRKQRKMIIGTSQIYSRMAKPLREQVRNVVLCKNFFSILQFNQLIDSIETKEGSDGQLKPVVQKRFYFFHSPKLYKMYDTYKLSMKPTNFDDSKIIIDNNNYMDL